MAQSIRCQMRLLSLLKQSNTSIFRRVYPVQSKPPPFRWASTAFQRKENFTRALPTPIYTVFEPAEDPSPALRNFREIQGVVSPETYKAITVEPFKHSEMTPVQAAVFDLFPSLAEPPSSSSTPSDPIPRDLLVKAKTGTGKTLAFLVPAIENRLKVLEQVGEQALAESGTKDQRLKRQAIETYARNNVGTLIISPTRELATQIANEALKLTSHHGRFNVCLFVGGESKGRQMREFNSRKDIIVATPGRLKDIIENTREMRPALKNVSTLILDEADTLLDMGFRTDIESIISELPSTPERQTFLFSATVSPAIRQIARQCLDRNHAFINTVSEDDSPVHAHIPQYYTVLPSAADLLPHVSNLIAQDQLQNPTTSKVVVFLNTTKMTQMTASMLINLKPQLPQPRTQILELHSKKDQSARTRISNSFRSDQSGAVVLVTSDVSARGVDYPGVTRVIQVGAPTSPDQYVHRVGRTGRGKNTQGRGDLVLLPFEGQFPKYNLDAVPLQCISPEEVQAEVDRLAEEHDKDPQASFPDVGTVSRRLPSGDRRWGPRPFPSQIQTRVSEIPNVATQVAKDQTPEKVEETYAAMLGYYSGQKENLRARPSDILNGCKDWVKDGMNMSPPPMSAAFLQKIGLGSDSAKSFRRPPRTFSTSRSIGGREHSNRSWTSRGSSSRRASWGSGTSEKPRGRRHSF